jgi:hypothetical protein
MILSNMMQWIDRFCRYETFGVKLKTELRLKRYRVLKF